MTLNIVGCLSMSTVGKRCVTIKAVCVHVHVGDNRETLCGVEHSNVSNKRGTLCDSENS